MKSFVTWSKIAKNAYRGRHTPGMRSEETVGVSGVLVAAVDHPAVHVAQHVRVDAMGSRIGSHLDVQTGGVEETVVFSRHAERNHRIGDAVADENAQRTQ